MGMASKLAAFVGRLTSAGKVPQAALDANVAGNGPAFSAYQSSAQTLSSSTYTKILFQSEEYDTNNNFTNSIFQPTVAGYYQVNAAFRVASSNTSIRVSFFKNAGMYKIGNDLVLTSSAQASTLVFMNGTTDYLEAYALIGTGQNSSNSSADTWFNGVLVRAA